MTAIDTDRSKKMKRLISIVSIVITAIIVCFCLLLIMVITSTFVRGKPLNAIDLRGIINYKLLIVNY